MISLQAFVTENLGKVVDVPGWPTDPECTDWALAWLLSQGGPGGQVRGNAVAWAGETWDGWIFIENTPTNMPAPGDIVVWGQNATEEIGPNGHVDVAYDSIAEMSFRGADQNWPEGSPVALVGHTYTGVLGWQHPTG